MLAFPNIDPVAVHLGPLAIRWYGLAYVAGFLAAWALMNKRAAHPDSDWDAEQVSDLVFYSALGIVLGGRLGYVLFYNLPVYLAHPLDIFKVWQGGMSFHGGLIGALLACALWGRGAGKGFLNVIDFLAPAVPIGLCLGRIANFINGELWGAPTDLSWGVVFPNPEAGGIPRHPSQLYEAGLEGLLLFVVLWWYTQRRRPVGAVAGLFLLGYGVLRFAVEFVRQPDTQLGYLAWSWLTMGQVLSLPVMLFGCWLLWSAYRRI
jgi:phosphatidylglycerol:prolipoprotein diacylglycerol transferase